MPLTTKVVTTPEDEEDEGIEDSCSGTILELIHESRCDGLDHNLQAKASTAISARATKARTEIA